MQRHHLLPCQLLNSPGLDRMLDTLGKDRLGFDDFRRNGLLLPASVSAALRIGLPMHRGPHPQYNGLVAERVGQIEAGWAEERLRHPGEANNHAVMRLSLLQGALRRRLLDAGRNRLQLNTKDPFRADQDFAELDAMADQIWAATAPVAQPVSEPLGAGAVGGAVGGRQDGPDAGCGHVLVDPHAPAGAAVG